MTLPRTLSLLLLPAAAVALVHGAGGCSSSSQTSARSSSSSPNPPTPPPSLALPADLAAALPRTDKGRPILMQAHAGMPAGLSLAFVYDESRDDPLTRWAECVDRVQGCYETNAGRIGGCIDLVPRCADDRGGRACCPPACIDAFKARLASGAGEDAAADAVFLGGDCVRGFAAMRDGAIGGAP